MIFNNNSGFRGLIFDNNGMLLPVFRDRGEGWIIHSGAVAGKDFRSPRLKGNSMSRKFIATIVAAAITVTGISAAPARAADQDDVAKLLFGAAAIYMISRAVKDDHSRVSSTSPRRPELVRPRPLPWRAHRFDPIPAQCLKHHETRKGTVRMIGQRCLQKRYRHVSYLPQKCHFKVRTYNGKRAGYKPGCLRKKGFVLAHR